MDPVALLFAVYLDSISNHVTTQATDAMGSEVKAIAISYQGMDVSFQHQGWRVKDKSVCQPHQAKLTQYSKCTLAAKALFGDLCARLSEKPSKHWRHGRSKTMYCNAAVSYRPTVASIGKASEETEDEKARAVCNLAIAAALGSRDPVVIGERERICRD